MDSILDDIKKKLGIVSDVEHFDVDIIDAINSAFATLTQLGVGDENGFEIEDNSKVWKDFIDDKRLNFVRTYVWLSVKMVFDPPQSSSVMKAYEDRIKELEWRMFVVKDNDTSGGTKPDPHPKPEKPRLEDIINGNQWNIHVDYNSLPKPENEGG